MQILTLTDLDLLSSLALAISLSIIYVSDLLLCVSPQPDTGCSMLGASSIAFYCTH